MRDEESRLQDEETERRKERLRAVGIGELLSLELPPRENVLSPWLPSQGLAMIYGPRGTGKTFMALGIGYAVACGAPFLDRWAAPAPRGVLYIDGEMPAVTIQERLARIVRSCDQEPAAPFKILTPDLQPGGMPNLSNTDDQGMLDDHLDEVFLVVVDNISCLCRSGRENEAESWLPVQEWALRMRTRGVSVLFIHHAGKGGGQRGTSRREDVLDTVISLRRPGDYKAEEGARFEIHFEKARNIHGDETKPFEVQLKTGADGGLVWTSKRLEDSLTERIAGLLLDGVPQSEIPEFLGVGKATVSRHKQKARERGLLKG
ncbi:MAG: AAA family ATPase [Nitrospirales bacterium]|nr:AAA family ATPase [Nitrospirales bacterium]